MRTGSRYRMRLSLCILSLLAGGTLVHAAAADEAGDGDTVALSIQATERAHLTEFELGLWKSPKFQRYFAQSYLAETEIEPTVTQSEREKMMKVLDLFSEDKLEEAARLLEKNVNDASSAVFEFTLANLYLQQERFDDAIALYEKAIEKYPKYRRAYKHLALAHTQKGERVKAIPALTQVLALGGGDVYTYGMLALAYHEAEDYLAAESAFRMAILLDPQTPDWKFGLADSLARQHRFPEVVALCDRLIAEDPNRADVWISQANAYIGLNQPVNAAINFEFVDRLGQSTPGSLYTLGDIYVNEGLFDTAVNAYIRAIEMRPQEGTDRVIRAARVLAAQGTLDDTKRLIEAVENVQANYIGTAQRKDPLKLRARIAMEPLNGLRNDREEFLG